MSQPVPPLVERLQDEADLCRNDGADDIAALLDEAVAEIRGLEQSSSTYFAERNSARDAWRARVKQCEALAEERDGLMQTLRDELDENLRLRELGGALPDENITAMTERLIRERGTLRAQLAIAARGLKHCAGWNINDDKRNALMAVVMESEALMAPGHNV